MLNDEIRHAEPPTATADLWEELLQASIGDAEFSRWFDEHCGTLYFPTAGPATQAQRIAAYQGWLAGVSAALEAVRRLSDGPK